ncbi:MULTISPECIES: S-layer homology domain-containing protein [unclassified Egicoccus]|uniref:S-layer homology domain-containing protein n=1 Tax=unclassified Egicoccus TaxID=2635606 RepID=UPI00359EAF0B
MDSMFDVVDAPSGRSDIFAAVVDGSSYPWERLALWLERTAGGRLSVLWRPMSMQFTGQWWAAGSAADGYPRASLVLNTDMRPSALPFTIAHELGHAVDSATLGNIDRARLSELMHRRPLPQLGHFDHDHRDAGHANEDWSSHANHYPSRLNEAFADLFVAAFCPEQWERRWPRFVHWTDDLDAFRRLVLTRDIPTATVTPDVVAASQEDDPMGRFVDVPDTATHARDIEDLAAAGIIAGNTDGTFKPGAPVRRDQMAAMLARALDKVAPGWRG